MNKHSSFMSSIAAVILGFSPLITCRGHERQINNRTETDKLHPNPGQQTYLQQVQLRCEATNP